MNEVKLQKALTLAGWGTLVAYLVTAFSNNMLQLARAKDAGMSGEALSHTSFIYLFGAILESPLHLPVGLLCLFAAHYIKQKPEPISEIFE